MIKLEDVFHVGFTGTRRGMSLEQKTVVGNILCRIRDQNKTQTLHHGCCVGADVEAHMIAYDMGFKIHLHPPLDTSYECDDLKILSQAFEVDPPYSYSGRNQRIVLRSNLVIATPLSLNGKGGTWNCLGHADDINKPRIIIIPDGRTINYGVVPYNLEFKQ